MTLRKLEVSPYNGIAFYKEDVVNIFNFRNRSERLEPKPGWTVSLCTTQVKFTDTVVHFQVLHSYDTLTVTVHDASDDSTIETLTGTTVYSPSSLPYRFDEYAIDGSDVVYNNIDRWYVKIQGDLDVAGTPTVTMYSEIQEWKAGAAATDEGYTQIAWRNSFNTPDMYWDSGIIPYMVLKAQYYKSIPFIEKTVYRLPDDNIIPLAATVNERYRFEFTDVAKYEHQMLAQALSVDQLYINNQEFVFQDGLDEPKYRTRYQLSDVAGLGTVGTKTLEICCNPDVAEDTFRLGIGAGAALWANRHQKLSYQPNS